MALLRRAPPPLPSHAPPLAASRRRCRLCGIWAVRSRRTVQIKRDRVPLRRSTVDRWTGSTAPVHRPCINPASASHQPTNRDSPRGASTSHPPAAQAFLQKGPCSFQNYINALPPYEIAPGFFGLNPRFSNLSNPQSRAHPFASKPS
jgi:hypothetical protein